MNKRIAVILDLDCPYQHHQGVFVGVQRYVEQQDGWDLVAAPYADPELLFPGTGSRYDGIVARATAGLARQAERLGVPLVNVCRGARLDGLPSVFPDRSAAGRMAAEHLLSRGFARFGYHGWRDNKTDQLQRSAFRSRIREAGCPCSVFTKADPSYESEAVWNRYQAELDAWIESWCTPIGIFTAFDLESRYLANACRRKHLNIPNDVALLGTQNETLICLQPGPSLSSIDLGYDAIGYRAAEILHDLMKGRPPPPEPVLLAPAGLFPRHSTDVYAVDDPVVTHAFRFMAENCSRPIKVDDVAAAVHMGRRSLERKFRTQLNLSVGGEITRLRVALLKRRLTETGLTMKDLAETCGFSDARQMNKTFQRVEGITPTAFRREHRST